MRSSENRLIKLQKEHRTLDDEIKRLYNTTHSERTLKNMKFRKLQLKNEITKLEGKTDG